MIYVNGWIKVRELKKDFKVDGLLEAYDDNSSTFFGKVLDCDEEIRDYLSAKCGTFTNAVLQLSRLNKTESLGGYLVKKESIIAIMTLEEFNRL